MAKFIPYQKVSIVEETMSNGTGTLKLIAPNNQFVHLGLHDYCCDGRVGVVFPAVHLVVGFKGSIPGLNIS